MSYYPDISADELYASANIDVPEQAGVDDDEIQAENLFLTSRAIGLLQTKPTSVQHSVYSELAAKYLPNLVAALRKQRAPNNAPMSLINCVGHTPYFMRFSKTRDGADLARIQMKRMAHGELLPSEDVHSTVAETCQFLSTLLVVYGLEFDEEDREPLMTRLKAWRAEFLGRFAEETTTRCIQILLPVGKRGEMDLMMPGMYLTLSLGVEMCMVKGCKTKKEEKELLHCSRCKTVRYCGKEHQKQDWPNHKSRCFSPSF